MVVNTCISRVRQEDQELKDNRNYPEILFQNRLFLNYPEGTVIS